MTMPQGPQGQQPPVNPNQPTTAFPAPGRAPSGPPPQGPPQGPPPQGPPHGPPQNSPQGLPPQNPPTRGGAYQGPPATGRPPEVGPLPQWAPQGPPAQGQPPRGMPPQGQFGAPNHAGAPRPQAANAIWALGLVSLVAVVCGLSISEDGANAWDSVHAWGAVAVLGALMTLATVVAAGNLGPARAWQVAACGAGALVLYWVLFVLPSVGSNTSLVTTIGVAAGAVAVWIAPGRDDATGRAADEPREHTW